MIIAKLIHQGVALKMIIFLIIISALILVKEINAKESMKEKIAISIILYMNAKLEIAVLKILKNVYLIFIKKIAYLWIKLAKIIQMTIVEI